MRRERAWPLLALLAAAAGAAEPDADPLVLRCHALQQQPEQAIGACEDAFARQAADGGVDVAQEMLLRRSDAELATGDFDAARRSIDRAAALAGAGVNWKSDYRLQRRRGILAYRLGQHVEALAAFRVALDLAASHGDITGEGRSWNDLGNALRRIGSYREALEAYLASLQKKRAAGDVQLGALMTNLGDLYRDLDDPKASRDYYTQALELHRQADRTLDLAHTHEALATLALDTRDLSTAQLNLNEAETMYRALGARADQVRVAARSARLALDQNDAASARGAIQRGLDLASQLAIPPSADLSLEAARLALLDDDARRADSLLAAALARLAPEAPEQVTLLKLRATTLARLGRTNEAYAEAMQFQAADARLRDREHDQRLEQLRIRFDVAEKERVLDRLAAENRLRAASLQQRTTQLRLVATAAVLALTLLGLLAYRSRERQRLGAARREAGLQADAAHYRESAAALRGDMQRVQALLDRSDSALIALDSSAVIVAANREAARLLDAGAADLRGRRLDEFIDAPSSARLAEALLQLDDAASAHEIILVPRAASASWPTKVLSLDDADGASVMLQIQLDAKPSVDVGALTQRQRRLQQAGARIATTDATTNPDVELSIARIEAEVAVLGRVTEPDAAAAFRRELVELMVATLAAWEQSTRTGAIELAEKSRVWRVAIDDGRLRVRAMERYLSLAKIPRHPRWREVLRTAYFVLAEAPLADEARADLRQRSEAVQAHVRRRALV